MFFFCYVTIMIVVNHLDGHDFGGHLKGLKGIKRHTKNSLLPARYTLGSCFLSDTMTHTWWTKNNGNKLKWYIGSALKGRLKDEAWRIIINPAQHHDKTNTVTHKLPSSADFYRSLHLHIWNEAKAKDGRAKEKPDTSRSGSSSSSSTWNMDRWST